MKKTRITWRKLLSILAIVGMLLPTGGWSMASVSRDAAVEPTSPETVEPTGAVEVLYRTRVTFPNTTARDHLDRLGVVVLEEGTDGALVLADREQLQALARLQFEPHASNGLNALVEANRAAKSAVQSLQPLLDQAVEVENLSAADDSTRDTAQADLRETMQSLSTEQKAALTTLSSVDDDADGLTNTQEQWWCTDPLDADSDGDGVSDGDEVDDLKAWLGNEAAGPPATGKPFVGWPPDHDGCYDDDQDSIPDLAERWELGLNMNRESTDRDKFDDGQELFGNTYCTGEGGYCSYGALPRDGDWGIIFAEMPSWVEKPGDHPLVAAFPVPEIDVVESSLHVETVTTVTTDHTISEGEEQSYSTAKTEGTSSSVSNTETWSEWQEVSVSRTTPDYSSAASPSALSNWFDNLLKGEAEFDATAQMQGQAGGAASGCGLSLACAAGSISNQIQAQIGKLELEGSLVKVQDAAVDVQNKLGEFKNSFNGWLQNANILSNNCIGNCGDKIVDPTLSQQNHLDKSAETQDRVLTPSGIDVVVNPQDEVEQVVYNKTYPTTYFRGSSQGLPQITRGETEGHSVGGARTTTSGQYEEHTVTNAESFSSEESWGTATAKDSSHAADLWFTYQVRNEGMEYAREICDLAFNVYIGDDPNPAYTYFVGDDLGGDGCFNTFMPDEEHQYTAHRIPLTLEQMKAIDLGGPVRVVVEDYTYGIDELFYEDAVNSNLQLAIEDGASDGDEAIDNYLIPTWGEETVLDVLARYFPHETDADGTLVSVWTPEQRTDTPSWCQEPRHVGDTLWCKHALSTADWWNVYTDGLGDGTEGFQDTPAAQGSTALFRFNKDADLDGYSDRSEERLGTDPDDAASHPEPELLAGTHAIREGDYVTSTLSLLNTGLYDAYGVESVMIAPEDSISVTNNTVGGSGRVRALKDVVVGSRILQPSYSDASWQGTAQPFSAGYYTGERDRVYSFTALDSGEVSTGTLRLAWDDGAGASGTLNFGDGYASPTPLNAGSHGVQVGLVSGEIQAGDTFTVAARTPRDTFQYAINREPYTEPVVLVSYNDPQGNHRFVTPITLTQPTDDLMAHSGQMLENLGAEIITQQPITTAGTYTTSVVTNWPADVTLEDAHLFLEFVNVTGTVAAEVPVTATMEPGPTVVPVRWSTDTFSPTFQTEEDYIVMAFWTDWQGNIIDTAARPLSSFQADPRPAFRMTDADATWDFGTAAQGTVLKRDVTFANTGQRDLLTYVSAPPGVNVSQTGSHRVGPADVTTYDIALNTTELPTGAYSETITIRTSDPENAVRTVQVTGTITDAAPDANPGSTERPLDWEAYISGDHSQGEWVQFTHNLGPDPQTLHPVKVYSHDRSTLWGVGKYATAFSQGTASYEMFGDGSDGDLTVSSGETFYVDSVRTRMDNSSSSGQKNVYVASTSGFGVGDEVLVIQMQGTGAGNYEFGMISSIGSGRLVLEENLEHSYNVGGDSKAQVLRVPQYWNVEIDGNLTCHAWNGATGGIVAFLASGQVTVNGSINVDAKGFRGGMPYRGGDDDAVTGQSGESQVGPKLDWIHTWGGEVPSPPGSANGGGGAGGAGRRGPDTAGGGGGGSYGSRGTDGQDFSGCAGGVAGTTYGTADLSRVYLGAGAGGGGRAKDPPDPGHGDGGNGGGIVLLRSRLLQTPGSILSRGGNGTRESAICGAGGGGSGGSILLIASRAELGANRVIGVGGQGAHNSNSGDGGDGGVGRIRVEYCDTLSGSTNPSASTQKLDCYIVEQIESSPYDTARLNLPESFTDGRHYWVQYGRRHVFGGAGEWQTMLRAPAAAFVDTTLDALVSDVGTGDLTLRLDVGDDGSWDWETTQSVDNAATFNSPDLSAAFNAYWAAQGGPLTGTLDVPVRVYLSKAGQVMLTNLQMTPTGSKVRYARLAAQDYADVTLDLTVGESGSGGFTVAADVGDDGTIDWTHSGSGAYPVQLATADLSTAFNAYLSGHSGAVDVPIRFYMAPFVALHLDDFSATPSATVDVTLSEADVAFGVANPTEGDTVPVTATLHNLGTGDSGGLSAAFYAEAPGWGDWYVGSAYVPQVPAGGTAQATIDWNTLGFTGTVPVRVEIDPTNRLTETNEGNNEANTSWDILTRPDLLVTDLSLSDDEPMVGERVTATLILQNRGQTPSEAQATRLETTGLTETVDVSALSGGLTTTVSVPWTPSAPGPYRLFAHADQEDVVDEYDESNNETWRDSYVGFLSPLLLDSGTGSDPAYTSDTGYGYVDTGTADVLSICGDGDAPHETLRRDPDGEVVYRFDHLLPGHFYHLDVTLYECDGAGRQESVYVDDTLVAGPEDLGDGEVHRLTTRLDPALYADHAVRVTVEAPGIDGAVVGEVNLYDVDYRYADAGGSDDPAYPGPGVELPYGWEDGVSNTSWGALPYQSVRVDQSDNELRYRFDGLEPDKTYNVHLTFWQPSGTGRIQRVRIDGLDTGLTVDSGDYAQHRETVAVPPTAYADDGSIMVSVVRMNASTGAMVNEIALEEETRASQSGCKTQPTPYFSEVYGDVTINGDPAPAGTAIQALNPRGETVGCYAVDSGGQYGFMRIYGEDGSATPPIPGMRDGEVVAFRVNGAPAVATPLFYWHDDHSTHRVDLNAGVIEGQSLLLASGWNLCSFHVEPPVPSIRQALASIDTRYDRVLGETGVYAAELPDTYNTLQELHTRLGYYVRITSTTSVNALVEGMREPITTPIPLHSGWNWVGYLPTTTLPITEALASIDGHYQRVLSLDKSYDVDLPDYSTLHEMTPGEGYLIYADDVVTLTYPADAEKSTTADRETLAKACEGMTPTPYLTLIYGKVTVNGRPAPPGTRITVVTPEGTVAGCSVVQQSGLLPLTHVYGADNMGAQLFAGFQDGEAMTIYVNGIPASGTALTWQDDRVPHIVSLRVTRQSIYLPLVSREHKGDAQ
jgi:hypothetical protein